MVRNSEVRHSGMPVPARAQGSTVVAPREQTVAYKQGQNEEFAPRESEYSRSRYDDEGEYDSYYGEGESEETVTEIVGEEVVEIESENAVEEQLKDEGLDNPEKLEAYLNVDQEQYIDEDYKVSPGKRLDDYNEMVSPINEDEAEHDETLHSHAKPSPLRKNYNSRLYPRQQRKRQSGHTGNKSHLIWEKERRARKRKAKKAQMSVYQYAPFDLGTGLRPDWTNAAKSKRVELPDSVKSHSDLWKQSNRSKVPMLSDHLEKSKNPLLHRDVKQSGKAHHELNNLFHESAL